MVHLQFPGRVSLICTVINHRGTEDTETHRDDDELIKNIFRRRSLCVSVLSVPLWLINIPIKDTFPGIGRKTFFVGGGVDLTEGLGRVVEHVAKQITTAWRHNNRLWHPAPGFENGSPVTMTSFLSKRMLDILCRALVVNAAHFRMCENRIPISSWRRRSNAFAKNAAGLRKNSARSAISIARTSAASNVGKVISRSKHSINSQQLWASLVTIS